MFFILLLRSSFVGIQCRRTLVGGGGGGEYLGVKDIVSKIITNIYLYLTLDLARRERGMVLVFLLACALHSCFTYIVPVFSRDFRVASPQMKVAGAWQSSAQRA